jgi:hypothetical protein
MQAMAEIQTLFIWDEVSGEVSETAIPPALIVQAKDTRELMVLCANWITDSLGDGEYDRREITQVGGTTKILGRYGRNMKFAAYLGDGAEELAHADLDAFPG